MREDDGLSMSGNAKGNGMLKDLRYILKGINRGLLKDWIWHTRKKLKGT